MTLPTLAGAAVSSAVLRMPHYGVWSADVTLAESPALTVGSRVELVLGDLTLTGTLRPGGDFGGTAHYTVIGGAGKWDSAIVSRGDRDDSQVMLSKAASDLATAAGEIGAVLEVPDRPLGYAWVRPAGRASDALRALAGEAWWVAADGVTHIGPRPVSAVSSPSLTVDPFDASTLRGTVRLFDDALAQLQPGAVLTAPGLPSPLAIYSLVARVEPGSLEADLFGERGVTELLVAIVDALTQWRRFHPAWPATVREVNGTRATVEPRDARAINMPSERFLDQAPGVPGLSAVLAVGAGVLVAFPAGDPGSPQIVGYLPGVLPDSVTLGATTEVNIGGAPAAFLAKAAEANLNFEAVWTALGILGVAMPARLDVSTDKAKGV